VKTETDTLIAITLPSEEKQQTEVKRYEGIKEAERLEKERIEKERVDGIKAKIEAFETDSYRIIQETKLDNVELHKTMLDAFVNAEFDYEEFDILFEQARERVQASWDAKCTDIQEKEEQRLKNEQLEKENAEAKRLSDLQASRLNEILPYVAFGEAVDLTNLSGLEESDYSNILASKKALFEADAKEKQEEQDRLDAENLEKENKAKADKEKIFEIRKNRLAEIGFELDGYDVFCHSIEYPILKEVVFNADAVEFETLVTDAKLAIEKAKADADEAEKQKTIDEQLAKEDAERLKKGNKERVKRLELDKGKLQKAIYVGLGLIPFESKNQEIKDFIAYATTKFEQLRDELLTELEKL